MSAMKLSNEAKTGIFVLICLAALLGLLIKIGNFSFFKQGYTLHTRFNYTGGVKANSPVRLSGVDVGEVRAIRLLDDAMSTVAEVDLWLVEGTKVRRGSKAIVSTLGMMGEKYIEIRVGTSAEFMSPNDLLDSEDPVRFEDLIEIGTEVAGDIGTMAKDISKVANTVDGTIKENRPKIGNIFTNLEETSENFNDFSQDVKYHPWKVLAKGKEVPKDQMMKDRETRRIEREARRAQAGEAVSAEAAAETVQASSETAPIKQKNNFARA